MTLVHIFGLLTQVFLINTFHVWLIKVCLFGGQSGGETRSALFIQSFLLLVAHQDADFCLVFNQFLFLKQLVWLLVVPRQWLSNFVGNHQVG